ncbi:MAG: MerR family DNA-binding transcriptional regulator [Actinomycetota bacterium]|nr:MerR family DNA-binding transcriptional regulator [Actinomycetota bacterium]
MDRYRISQAAERAGMPATTLRYDESRGLLPARDTPEPDPPIACTLTGSEQVDRAGRWHEVLAGAPREDLPDGGIRVRPPAERVEEVTALVAAESRCCPFLTFHLSVGPGGITLDAHAPDGARELLRELLG